MNDDTYRIIDVVLHAVEIIALLLAAGWAYYRLRKERSHDPHIEFSVNCNFYGPIFDEYIVEFLLSIDNKGLVRQNFRGIKLRIRGIGNNQALAYWKDNEPRLAFPISILDVQMIPENYNFYFVEPGVRQDITYVTKLPASTTYLLAHAQFEYRQFTPHTTERVFPVVVGSA